MAANKRDPQQKGFEMRKQIAESQGQPFNEIFWIDPTLSDEEQAQLKAWGLPSEKLDGYLEDLCNEGFKITFTFEERQNCYAVRLWPAKNDRERANMCLVGRGSTPLRALRQVAYKHFTMLETDWTRAKKPPKKMTFND